jgi:hypothetical protein
MKPLKLILGSILFLIGLGLLVVALFSLVEWMDLLGELSIIPDPFLDRSWWGSNITITLIIPLLGGALCHFAYKGIRKEIRSMAANR